MPYFLESSGESIDTSEPLMKILPSSGLYIPESIFISVVLPEPFSPRRARISPDFTVRLTPLFATTLPKVLVMPLISMA